MRHLNNSKIGVGIVGASIERSWAARAHIPALRALREYEIRAVATTRIEFARATASALGVPLAFEGHAALVEHPDVDLVVVSVKVPFHYEIVRSALDAGKMVYCEWPLGNNLAEAEALADLARARNIRTVAGLQWRFNPEISRIRELIEQGYLDKVLSTSMIGAGWLPAAETEKHRAYLRDQRNGAGPMTVLGGHKLDMLCHTLGEFERLIALSAIFRPQVRIVESGETIEATAPDQLVVSGALQSGALVSARIHCEPSRGPKLQWVITGTEGELFIEGNRPYGAMELSLKGGRQDDKTLMPIPVAMESTFENSLVGFPLNVARLYRQLSDDIKQGTRLAPDFGEAVTRHRMIDAIEKSAAKSEFERYGQ